MEIKHTPGPWNQDEFGHIVDKSGKNVLFRGVSIAMGYAENKEPEHNTALATAAPELLEALQLLLEQDDNGEDEIWVRNKAREAIAKATGEVKWE